MNDQVGGCRIFHTDEATHSSSVERGVLIVSWITLATMLVEILFGWLTGSMALLADGAHMGTHAFALLVTLSAYIISRRERKNRTFSFGTGKVGVLGGYTNALLLGGSALVMLYESVYRLLHPIAIHFDTAIIVTLIGLVVNALSLFILERSHKHDHGCDHDHHDANFKGALFHIAADLLTSLLALVALTVGKFTSIVILDPLMGVLAAFLILKWSYSLLTSSASILLDMGNHEKDIAKICDRLNLMEVEVSDIHIWRVSERDRSLILSVKDKRKRGKGEFYSMLNDIATFKHITLEVCHEA